MLRIFVLYTTCIITILYNSHLFIDIGNSTKILQRRQLSSVKIIQRRTLFVFTTDNRFRLFCHSVINMKHFDHIMLVIIILSSVLLAMEDPLDENSKKNEVLHWTYCGCALLLHLTATVPVAVRCNKKAQLLVIVTPNLYFIKMKQTKQILNAAQKCKFETENALFCDQKICCLKSSTVYECSRLKKQENILRYICLVDFCS